MRGKWLLISGILILLAVAAGALSWLWRSRSSPAVVAPAPPPRPAVFVGSEVSLLGKIRAQHIVPVAVPVEGTIEYVSVEVGQDVYEGEVLARIRNTGLETAHQVAAAEAERAQSRLNSLESTYIAARLEASRAHAEASRSQSDFARAEKAYLRQQMWYREGATPRLVFEKTQKEFEAAQTQYRTLEELARQTAEREESLHKEMDHARRVLEEKNQQLEEAKSNLAGVEIRSPADGILVGRTKQPGEEVTPEVKDLFQIAVDLSALEAVLEPEPPALERIRIGQEAILQVAEIPGEGLPGKVKEIKGSDVTVEFVNPSPAIRPGLTAQVRIKLR
jgi:multidrug resistance efflux pump